MLDTQGMTTIDRALLVLAAASGCAVSADEADTGAHCVGKCDGGGGYSSETTLLARLDDQIWPSFDKGTFGRIQGQPAEDGAPVSLAYVAFEAPREQGAIVLVQGRAESFAKYAETIADLVHAGYSVYALDHRGQGLSDRLLPEATKGHVESYANYVADLATFVDQVVRPAQHEHVFGLSHSMGGVILTRYAIEHPNVLDALVVASPMFGLQFPTGTNETTAYLLAKAAIDTWDAVPYEDFTIGFEGNGFTSSRARYEYAIDRVRARYPETEVKGPTFGWLEQSILAMQDLRERAPALTVPVRLLQASSDGIVDNESQNALCSTAQACEVKVIAGARHELFTETDRMRFAALDLALGWFSSH